MIIKIKNFVKKIIAKTKKNRDKQNIDFYLKNGREPWSRGYHEYKTEEIKKNIVDTNILTSFQEKKLPDNYGFRLDERIVEYGWIFSNLTNRKTSFLDAGSTFNFQYLLETPILQQKDITIYTYYPESPNFNEKRISYHYGDLRSLPFKSAYFEEIVCQSTIEHIDMDNAIYGYELASKENSSQKNYEYLKAIEELIRILNIKGTLLLTFPYGKFENHGFFQQLDHEMVEKIFQKMNNHGSYEIDFFRYMPQGWTYCSQDDCKEIVSFNPHSGQGKGDDGAAHCRSICFIKFIKN